MPKKSNSPHLYRSTLVYIVAVFLIVIGLASHLFVDAFEISSLVVTLGVVLLPLAYNLSKRKT